MTRLMTDRPRPLCDSNQTAQRPNTLHGSLLLLLLLLLLLVVVVVVVDEYELWGLKLNVKKTKYMAIGDTSRDLQLEDRKGIISHVNEYTYLGVRITKEGNHDPEINDRINRGRAGITKLNSILWDREVTPKTKTHIYHEIVKSTITYAAETWCLKAKPVAKLNSTEMDFWRSSVRISWKNKIGNNIIKQKMNLTRSLLEHIKTEQLKLYGNVQRMEEGRLPKKL